MKKRIFFVFNMHAGKARIKTKLSDILNTFTEKGYEVTAYPTRYAGEAVLRIEALEDGYELVVCSGGDGTLDEVVTGMMRRPEEKRIPIGYIPAGSTNDFAKSLGLPQKMEDAAARIMAGKRFPCDIGAFNQDYFVYIAAFGIFTDVSYQTDQQMKNVLGHMAYILEGMKRLTNITSYKMKLRWEDREVEDDFLFGMVTNSRSVGGFKSIIGTEVVLDDGVFEVTFIKRPKNLLELNETLTALVLAEIDERYMYSFRTSRLTVEAEAEVPWTLDGEYGGDHRAAVIENRKQALEFIV